MTNSKLSKQTTSVAEKIMSRTQNMAAGFELLRGLGEHLVCKHGWRIQKPPNVTLGA